MSKWGQNTSPVTYEMILLSYFERSELWYNFITPMIGKILLHSCIKRLAETKPLKQKSWITIRHHIRKTRSPFWHLQVANCVKTLLQEKENSLPRHSIRITHISSIAYVATDQFTSAEAQNQAYCDLNHLPFEGHFFPMADTLKGFILPSILYRFFFIENYF
jgi:hypothetical protein